MSQLARALAVILGAQLAGEIGVRALGVPVPGPVFGMALLAIGFAALPRLADLVRPAAEGLLAPGRCIRRRAPSPGSAWRSARS